MDIKSIEILTRWKSDHEVRATISDMAARSAVDLRDIQEHREQAAMHRDAAAFIAARLADQGGGVMHNDDDLSFFWSHGPDCSCGPVSAEDRHHGADRELPDPMDLECEALPEVEHSDEWWAEAMALARVDGDA